MYKVNKRKNIKEAMMKKATSYEHNYLKNHKYKCTDLIVSHENSLIACIIQRHEYVVSIIKLAE